MATINEIVGTQPLSGEIENRKKTQGAQAGTIDFANTIGDFLEAVNTEQQEASAAVEEIVTRKSDNIAQAMTKLEEAGLSFQLMLKIRNKLVDAYNEIKRMQV